ncbi:MAG: hypothetical protein ACKVOR_07645 [Flavobacteriales bacterium]
MKNKYITLMLAACTVCSGSMQAQEIEKTLHLNHMMKVSDEDQSTYRLELRKIAGETYSGIVYDFMNTIKAEGTYVLIGNKYMEDGHFTYYYQDGQIESEGEYDRGVKVGTWKRYDNYGKRKTDKYYPAESADKIREMMMMEKEE